MSHGKQFTLYSHDRGPNGWKVAFALEELGLTYETIYLNFQEGEHKKPEFTKFNPNSRIPALIDHKNNDFVIWESNAILLYLVDKYDTEKRITVPDGDEKFQLLQWLFFQASGQGPYFGQAAWFALFHPERIESATDRYKKEIIRVLGVLETVLSKQEWLVGGKLTIADLSFITWNNFAFNVILQGYESFNLQKDFPSVAAWHNKLLATPSVKKTLDVREALISKK
ncbi:glutathione S-transferase C-terminal-like protein [Abortiporus biennis]|nr:glutathione S-transferase C-terminal-like protein [Abortiporus biennis]